MAQVFRWNGERVSALAAELAFQQWFLSLATEGMVPESLRNALYAAELFQAARDSEYARDALRMAGITIQD
jgi:hypothetical protein